MAQRNVRIGVELDRETDADFQKWAESEGRSKRRHGAILLRHLTDLFKSHRADLERLGLVAKRPSGNPSN
jgi:hypothetical protein